MNHKELEPHQVEGEQKTTCRDTFQELPYARVFPVYKEDEQKAHGGVEQRPQCCYRNWANGAIGAGGYFFTGGR